MSTLNNSAIVKTTLESQIIEADSAIKKYEENIDEKIAQLKTQKADKGNSLGTKVLDDEITTLESQKKHIPLQLSMQKKLAKLRLENHEEHIKSAGTTLGITIADPKQKSLQILKDGGDPVALTSKVLEESKVSEISKIDDEYAQKTSERRSRMDREAREHAEQSAIKSVDSKINRAENPISQQVQKGFEAVSKKAGEAMSHVTKFTSDAANAASQWRKGKS